MFSTLGDDALERIAQRITVVHLTAGQTLFSRGDEPDAAFLVVEGEIIVEVFSSGGRALRLAALGRGELFGELAALDGGHRTADARSGSACTLYRIAQAALLELATTQAAFSHALTLSVIARLRSTNHHIETVVWETIRSRLASLLLELCVDESYVKITQFALAEELSVTREKVNIRLQEFQKAGALKTGRGHVEILDRNILRTFVNPNDH